jgi:hypothetical protein
MSNHFTAAQCAQAATRRRLAVVEAACGDPREILRFRGKERDCPLPRRRTWPSLPGMLPLGTDTSRLRARIAAFISLGLGITLGCGSTQKSVGGPGSDLKISQDDMGAKFDRSRCDDRGKQVVTLDANGDGKPDVIKLFLPSYQDGHQVQQLVCKQTDLDFDGKIDLVQYFGPNGELFMDEYSMNYSGKFNGRTFFQEGKKVRAEKDMDFDGKADYFEFFEGGKLVRVERDRNGDGKVDEWQYYENGKLDRVGFDTTGTGRVDKWDRGPEGGADTQVAQAAEPAPAAVAPVAPAAAADAAAAAAAADAASRGASKSPAKADSKTAGKTDSKNPPKK